MPARETPDTTPRTPEGAIDWDRMLAEHEAYCAGSRTIQAIDRMAAMMPAPRELEVALFVLSDWPRS